ncbi:MAG: thiamine-binding protein [Bacteroidia bacterium]|nr:thiamine-binding protein [Bacteroidia bacterium]MCZ2248464.1 thiamine-binding protein [Bacteroidia bacterium]
MKNLKTNVAIQLLPLGNNINRYAVVDEAIDEIKKSGLNYQVCPFETVVEGRFEEIVTLVENIKNRCLKGENTEIIMNLKLHCHQSKDLHIEDKTGKYKS